MRLTSASLAPSAGLRIFKENGVSDEKLLYAGNVLAQLLDNDANGKVDNKKVWRRLKKIYGEKIKGKRPMLFIPIFKDFNSPAERDLFQLDIQVGAVLCKSLLENRFSLAIWSLTNSIFADDEEVQPAYPALQGLDATFEEIIHNIFAGFPKVWGGAYGHFNLLSSGKSKLNRALNQARGGRFTSVPNQYPSSAIFTYDDRTCDYECQAVEYHFWVVLTRMGKLEQCCGWKPSDGVPTVDLIPCETKANEWLVCSYEELLAKNPKASFMFEPKYAMPTIPPDGNYAPSR